MICGMYGVTTNDRVSSQDRMGKMQLQYMEEVLHTHQPIWHGHI